MTENLETKLIPIETLQTQIPEVKVGENSYSTDVNREFSLQPVGVQSSIAIPQEKSVPTQSPSPDKIITTGDEWNEAIKNKELGVAPTVL